MVTGFEGAGALVPKDAEAVMAKAKVRPTGSPDTLVVVLLLVVVSSCEIGAIMYTV